jgi:hypothetical protein
MENTEHLPHFPCKKRTHASVMSTLDTAGSSGSADCGNRKCGDTVVVVVVDGVHEVISVVSRIMPREDRVDRVVSWLAGEHRSMVENKTMVEHRNHG